MVPETFIDRIKRIADRYRNFIILAVICLILGAFIVNPLWTYISK